MLGELDLVVLQRRLQRLATPRPGAQAVWSLRRQRALEALQRIAEGCFGLCTGCLLQIEHARLLADPAANLCPECEANARPAPRSSVRKRAGVSPVKARGIAPGF